MAKLLVFYHSRTGNTHRMAEAVAEGARMIHGAEVELKTDMDVNPEDLGRFGAIAVGAPTYRHDMAMGIKNLLQDVATKSIATKGRVGLCFGSYGWSGEAPRLVLDFMRDRLEMNVVEPPLLVKNSPGSEDLEKRRELGRTVSKKIIGQ